MKYDDASWHYEADNFPSHLPPSAGATHTGMFLAWSILSGTAGELHVEDFPVDIQQLNARLITPGAYFFQVCDGKFTDEELNEIGNQFAQEYFDFENGQYLQDYSEVLGDGDGANLYAVADTWDNFDRLKPVLDQRFKDWIGSDR